jgi:hypothetical protein
MHPHETPKKFIKTYVSRECSRGIAPKPPFNNFGLLNNLGGNCTNKVGKIYPLILIRLHIPTKEIIHY